MVGAVQQVTKYLQYPHTLGHFGRCTNFQRIGFVWQSIVLKTPEIPQEIFSKSRNEILKQTLPSPGKIKIK